MRISKVLVSVVLVLMFMPRTLPPLEVMGVAAVSTEAVGKGPAVFGRTIAFTTSEVAVQTDLNGDGNVTSDAEVIRIYNVMSGTVTNTGASVEYGTSPSVFGSLVVFAAPGGRIRYYNTTSGTVFDTGLSGLAGESPRTWGDSVVFTGSDLRIKVYTVSTRSQVDTGAVGSNPSVHDGIVAFSTGEGLAQADLDGNGTVDPGTSVVRYYELATRRIVNTRELGERTGVYGSMLAFDYALNAPVRFYNTTSGTAGDTGLVGFSPSVYGDNIFLGNGTIRMYQLSTGTGTDTRVDGENPSAYQNLVGFETDENIVDRDLNGDRLIKDVVIRYSEVPFHDVSVVSLLVSAGDLARPVDLSAVIVNNGEFPETFNVVFLWNSTLIGQVAGVSLASTASTTVPFHWDTANLLAGAYRLSVRAGISPGDVETVNNMLVDGILIKPVQLVVSGGGGGGVFKPL